MKHKISIILAAAVILSLLTGCGAAGKQASTIAENEEEYEFDFVPDELPAAAIDVFQLTELSVDSLVGSWHLAEETDLETLSEVFPGAAEFGSRMEIRSDGNISWYIGADGAMGTYIIEGNAMTADVTGELDGEAYRITLRQPEPKKLTMTFKEFELVWTYGEGDSLRGED